MALRISSAMSSASTFRQGRAQTKRLFRTGGLLTWGWWIRTATWSLSELSDDTVHPTSIEARARIAALVAALIP